MADLMRIDRSRPAERRSFASRVREGRTSSPRVAIVLRPWTNFDTFPSLRAAALLLSQCGYRVDIFTPFLPNSRLSGDALASGPLDAPITFTLSRTATLLEDVIHLPVCDRIRRLGHVYRLLRGCWRLVWRSATLLSNLTLPLHVWRSHRRDPYRCFIGVDADGLVHAHRVSRLAGVPLVYYSLELLLSREIREPRHKRLKRREIPLSRKAAFIIIQDAQRAQLLAEDNNILSERFVLVPNAPLGPARRKPSGHWHQHFGLPSDRRIVLHAGNVARWTAIADIVDSVRAWPDDWILVVHTYNSELSSATLGRLRESAVSDRVFFSLGPASPDDYDMMVDGADLGIAFYVPTDETAAAYSSGENIRTIGLSSGKIAYYLRAGLPVVVNDTGSLSDIVSREGCGVAVRSAGEIPRAIAEISQGYDQYSDSALRVFEKHFNFAAGFQSVINRIDSLAEASP